MSSANKRTVHTLIQGVVAFAVALPAIVNASGIPTSLPWVAGALAVAGGLARVMALPAVEALLDRVGLGLADNNGDGSA
ncbi:hypothetical protein [Streptomyces rapamycinicus]|uniref:Holin n=2 Tax=Streptomyces rapamycinicus TaxID=1226757 RepID=A0A0A0NIK3_STRRN|nr:hypothetical protein [Streptomyces rapamycinicus]AGP56814.1 hypothetical protein M271_26700 [Streptomyces rapamycinicus NRRL 5491]MBB4784426.1 hypothetical protein [Streptomyces rapamycinicus]RLV80090.1 hypothetical protein D3C57_116935 [Streptomyces rapamycinicus NRRL 5491]UTO64737.1 hypothetical protein LJB45_22010 [Streptomyces rapamycinicus]UTP32694.1 hypothetical protein LIV37_27135 [Streptomyces rapamycinicus NRRL 5491]